MGAFTFKNYGCLSLVKVTLFYPGKAIIKY